MTLQKINDSPNSTSPQSHLTHVNSCSEARVRCQRVGCQTLQDMIQVRSLEMSSPLGQRIGKMSSGNCKMSSQRKTFFKRYAVHGLNAHVLRDLPDNLKWKLCTIRQPLGYTSAELFQGSHLRCFIRLEPKSATL